MVNPDRNLYEPPYDDALLYDGDLEPERPRSRPLVVLLGIVVMAAFAGVVWVAYNQGVKQGQNGSPPILTADAGPTRIVPDTSATSQTMNPAPDKSYERLWGEAPEGDGQANVLPQPEQPRTVPAPQTALAPQDVATNTATPPGSSTSIGGPFETKATDVQPPSEDPRMDSTVGSVSSSASAPRTITSQSPAMFGPKPQAEDITSALPPVESVSPPVTAPRSLTPSAPKQAVTKPVTVTQSTAAAPAIAKLTPKPAPPVAASPPEETKVAELAPATDPAPISAPPAASGGSAMIQLGSFPNDGLAASAWSKIKSANQALLGSYSPSIKSADIPGKGTWYRLRVGGFADKNAAADVCEQLKASGQACIVAAK